MKNSKEVLGVDVTNFRTDDEYGYHPYFGTYKKWEGKRNRPEPERKPVERTPILITESYHDENGQLRQRTYEADKVTLNLE